MGDGEIIDGKEEIMTKDFIGIWVKYCGIWMCHESCVKPLKLMQKKLSESFHVKIKNFLRGSNFLARKFMIATLESLDSILESFAC